MGLTSRLTPQEYGPALMIEMIGSWARGGLD